MNLQQLCNDRFKETHVLCASNRQPVKTKMANHFWYRFKWSTELPQDIFAGIVLLLNSHVHEALGTPDRKENNRRKV
ncbi:CLUMA_CG003762, isoform A [Clunio marinus]|uniref:CLUMA_CG003762, isoform A n=1 Tax=Clunio marinus TaxID=568069 RepID=A0A1J1HRL9_9DIPT|nr:CLUMA_CG003762, isoform A [Clunio marinus]